MAQRLVLRIEREGQLLGSWTIGDAPLDMSVVDERDGRVLARFQASSEDLRVQEPVTGGSLDELPHPGGLARTDGDDFTMPLPEPTATGRGRVHRPAGGPRPLNLARPEAGGAEAAVTEDVDTLENIDESLIDGEGTGSLTGELVPMEEDLFDVGDTEPNRPADDLDALAEPLTTSAVAPLTEEAPMEESPSEEVTDPAPADTAARRRAAVRNLAAPPPRPGPPPAEVWAQRQGEWTNVGHLSPGQRVRTLGGWIRLAPDGRLVVSSGEALTGTATLIDGRMVEIDASRDFVALPAGTSVMLAVGDKGIYVRSEPVAEPAAGGDPDEGHAAG